MAMRRHHWGTLPFTCPKHHKNHLQTATHPNSTSLLGKILSAPSYSKRGSANTVEHDAALEHDPNAAKLVRAEDDLTAWKEIEVLATDLDADVAPPAVVEDGKDENLTDACTDTGDQVPTNPGHGWWASGVAISVWHKPRRRCMLAPCGIPAQADQGLCYSGSYK